MDSEIALVHDYFIQMGGAERVAETFREMFPDAPFYTTVDLRQPRPAAMRTSWMQRLPRLKELYRQYFMLYPLAVGSLNLARYDLILSSTSGYAKGVRKRRGAVHVCYCHTPTRWVWRYEDYAARENFGKLTQTALPWLLAALRQWDYKAAQRPDYYLANSQVVAARIKAIYGREAHVIPPPVDVERFTPDGPDEDYYLLLSRLVPYKRLDLAITACRAAGRPLVVIGDGPDRQRLEQLAGPQTRFLGRQPDEVVNRYATSCRALLFPGEEDFGLTPLEINASGRPVIAFRAGGALETVSEGETGVFFDQPTARSLAAALEDCESREWHRPSLRRHAEKFGRDVFIRRLHEFLRQVAPSSCVPLLAAQRLRPAF